MHKLRAEPFFKAFEQLAVLHQTLNIMAPGTRPLISKHTANEICVNVEILREELISLGLSGAAATVSRGLDLLNSAEEFLHEGRAHILLDAEQLPRIKTAFSQATSRIPDDLAGHALLVIDPRRIHLYEQPKIFGDAVFDAFPSANEDISEAGTCLALNRGTACVMHLMRVLEAGLAALASALNVNKQNDWGSYLREIDKKLVARTKDSGARSIDEQFFAEVATSIDNMRRAWRNPTMHPDKSYSVERAEEIMGSVRSFMRHLATKLRE